MASRNRKKTETEIDELDKIYMDLTGRPAQARSRRKGWIALIVILLLVMLTLSFTLYTACYGNLLDGRDVIILFKNALCTSGFTTDAKHKTNALFKGTFTCMSDMEHGTTKLPYAIFIRKQDGWTATTPEDLTGTTPAA